MDERASPRRCHPCQFLPKSFQISGRKNYKKTFFALGNGIFRREKSFPHRTRCRVRLKAQEDFGPLELSYDFSTVRAPSGLSFARILG